MSRLLPKVKPVARQVFLEPELWTRLSKVATFHSEVFKALEVKQSVSRNDIIAAFLEDAVPAYWEKVGGEPEQGTKDWQQKVKQFAEQMAEVIRADEDSE